MKRLEEFQRIQTFALFAVIIGVGIIFFRMITPYLFPLFWAAIIASLFHPVYKRLSIRTHRDSIASFLTVLIALFVVVLPLTLVIGLIVEQTISTVQWISSPETIATLQLWLERVTNYPLLQQYSNQLQLTDRIQSASATLAQWSFRQFTEGSRNTIQIVISFFIMLYALYYFLKDGAAWLRRFMELLPLGNDNEELLYKQFVSTARATLKGTLLIGVVQGSIGGVLFAVTGIPSAAFWGLIMILFAIIPAVGPALVLIPVAIYFLVTAAWWQAAVIIIGIVVTGLIDNLLRPPLVGKDLQMHSLLILLATIGGIGLFGISGVVIGPMVAAFFFSLIRIYETKYKQQLDNQG